MSKTTERERSGEGRPPSRRPGARGLLVYSRFVGAMRWLLPVVALGLILLVALWPQLKMDEDEFRIGFAALDMMDVTRDEMLNPRYTGVDEEDQPFTVTASKAIRAQNDASLIELDKPQADMTLDNQAWVSVTAREGIYNQDSQVLDLSGEVAIFHDSGYQFHTESARLDLNRKTARGEDPVTGHGPLGQIVSDGFFIDHNKSRVPFTGQAKLIGRFGQSRSNKS